MPNRNPPHRSRASAAFALTLLAGALLPSLGRAQGREPSAAPPGDQQPETEAQRRQRQEQLARQLDDMEQQLQRAARSAGQTADELARRAGEGVGKAQQQLRQSVPEIQKQVDKLQRSLEDLQGALSIQSRTAHGVVRDVSAHQLDIVDADGKVQAFRTDERTYVVRGDEELGREALKPGTPVRVTFVLLDQKHVAREVELVQH